jgi:hypothetical protein
MTSLRLSASSISAVQLPRIEWSRAIQASLPERDLGEAGSVLVGLRNEDLRTRRPSSHNDQR